VSGRLLACVDFGSTFTKAALVDVDDGLLLATAGHPTTASTDVMDGLRACLADLAHAHRGAREAEVRACSSAGGGLRVAVVGNEELVTAEAGRRVALSSGGKVVHVRAGLEAASVASLREAAPDVVLLVGGTDGGNAEVLLASARALAEARWPTPVVVAGNVTARDEVAGLLAAAGTPHVPAANVLPRIGALAPDSARAAIRAMFLAHVIGGKHLSADPAFAGMVRGATPDVVLAAVELLAGLAGDVVVVDVGGATTDVHSVVEVPEPDRPGPDGLSREVVAPSAVSRTVEGDLGMRWSAPATVEAAEAAGLLAGGSLREAADVRAADPAYLPVDDQGRAGDLALAAAAVGLALRRHAGRAQVVLGPDGRVVERSGKDLRDAGLLVGSGGVLRHSGPAAAGVLTRHLTTEGGWQLPERPSVVVDTDYLLAPAGLLAGDHPDVAAALLGGLLERASPVTRRR
jgi:uncharacterized protein (TIGR01319 family)